MIRFGRKLIPILILCIAMPPGAWAGKDVTSRTVDIGGEPIHLMRSVTSTGGHPEIESFIAGDISQIRFDRNQDGYTDIMVIENDRIKITAFNPYKGLFLNLNAAVRERTGIRHLTLYLSHDRKNYILFGQRFEKFGKYADSSGANYLDFSPMSPWSSNPVCMSRDSNLDRILGKSIMRNLDKSCQNLPITQSISEGERKVLSSYEGNSSNPARYLACLKEQNLAFLGDAILVKFFKDARIRQWKRGGGTGRRSGEDRAFTKAMDNLREHTGGTKRKNTDLLLDRSLFASGGEEGMTSWLSCENPSAPNPICKDDLGYYDNDLREIVICDNEKRTVGMSPQQKNNFYADLIFHESLHSIGILDETAVTKLEECCGVQTKDLARTMACKEAKDYLEKELKQDMYIAQIIGLLPASFQDYFMGLARKFGLETAKNMIQAFGNGFYGSGCMKEFNCGDSVLKNAISDMIAAGCKPSVKGMNVDECKKEACYMENVIKNLSNSPDAEQSCRISMQLLPERSNRSWSLWKLLLPYAEAQTAEESNYSCIAGVFNTTLTLPPINEPIDLRNLNRYSPKTVGGGVPGDGAEKTGGAATPDFGWTSPTASVPFDLDNLSATKAFVEAETTKSHAFLDAMTQMAKIVSDSALPAANAAASVPSTASASAGGSIPFYPMPAKTVSIPSDFSGSGGGRNVPSAPSVGGSGNIYAPAVISMGNAKKPEVAPSAGSVSRNSGAAGSLAGSGGKTSPNMVASSSGGRAVAAVSKSGKSSRVPASTSPSLASGSKLRFATRLDLAKYLRATSYETVLRDMVERTYEGDLKALFSQVVAGDGRKFGANEDQAVFIYSYDRSKKAFVESRKGQK